MKTWQNKYCSVVFAVGIAMLYAGFSAVAATISWSPNANGGDGVTWSTGNTNWNTTLDNPWNSSSRNFANIGAGNPTLTGTIYAGGISCSGNISGSGQLRIYSGGNSTISGNVASTIDLVAASSNTLTLSGNYINHNGWTIRQPTTLRLDCFNAMTSNTSTALVNDTLVNGNYINPGITFELAAEDENFVTATWWQPFTSLTFAAIGAHRRATIVTSGSNLFNWTMAGNLILGNSNSTHTLIWTSSTNLRSGMNYSGNCISVVNGAAAIGGEIYGNIVGYPGDKLTKSNSGTLQLSGNNIYSGETTVAAGTLLVGGYLSASCNTMVNSGSILGGNGLISGNINILNGGTMAAGNVDHIGSLICGANITWESSSANNHVYISGANGIYYNQITATAGVVSLNNATLVLNDTNATENPAYVVIVDNQTSNAISGIFNGLPNGATVTSLSGRKWLISYTGGTGNDIVLYRPRGMMIRFY